jgi:hypothetical protein
LRSWIESSWNEESPIPTVAFVRSQPGFEAFSKATLKTLLAELIPIIREERRAEQVVIDDIRVSLREWLTTKSDAELECISMAEARALCIPFKSGIRNFKRVVKTIVRELVDNIQETREHAARVREAEDPMVRRVRELECFVREMHITSLQTAVMERIGALETVVLESVHVLELLHSSLKTYLEKEVAFLCGLQAIAVTHPCSAVDIPDTDCGKFIKQIRTFANIEILQNFIRSRTAMILTLRESTSSHIDSVTVDIDTRIKTFLSEFRYAYVNGRSLMGDKAPCDKAQRRLNDLECIITPFMDRLALLDVATSTRAGALYSARKTLLSATAIAIE